MKTEAEIQRAHDLLHAFVLRLEELSALRDAPLTVASLEVLCWTLGHDNNPQFAENLLKLEAFLFGKGIELVDTGQLNYPDGEDGT